MLTRVPMDPAGRRAGDQAGLLRRHPQIADDEALIVEFPVPDRVPLLADPGCRRPLLHRRLGQPAIEPQRRAGPRRPRRLVSRVVSKQDPGVHNWLDKADWPWGILQARFYRPTTIRRRR